MDGFSEVFHRISYDKIGTSTIQSRATAGVAGATFIFVLPGSPGACRDAWDGILEGAARLPPPALQLRRDHAAPRRAPEAGQAARLEPMLPASHQRDGLLDRGIENQIVAGSHEPEVIDVELQDRADPTSGRSGRREPPPRRHRDRPSCCRGQPHTDRSRGSPGCAESAGRRFRRSGFRDRPAGTGGRDSRCRKTAPAARHETGPSPVKFLPLHVIKHGRHAGRERTADRRMQLVLPPAQQIPGDLVGKRRCPHVRGSTCDRPGIASRASPGTGSTRENTRSCRPMT